MVLNWHFILVGVNVYLIWKAEYEYWATTEMYIQTHIILNPVYNIACIRNKEALFACSTFNVIDWRKNSGSVLDM